MNEKVKAGLRAAIVAFVGALLGGAIAPDQIAGLLRLIGL
jgi:hypothetical protein